MWAVLFALLDLLQPQPLPHSAGGLDLVQSWSCADVSCKQLGSCEEACYKLLECGQAKRDGDGDGIPCENLCKRPCE